MIKVLNDRYEISECLEKESKDKPEVWKGYSCSEDDNETYTFKIWRYNDKPPLEILRLWDNDLRIQYRLVSTPGADDTLITLIDAGHDIKNKSLVMVYGYGDYCRLDSLIQNRSKKDNPEWASLEWLKSPENRLYLWQGLKNIALGLKLLHDQSLVHRNVHPGNVFYDPAIGPQSLRLGGFDFSLRLSSSPEDNDILPKWHLPPESNNKPLFYNFSTDWYGFGVLASSCFIKALPDKAKKTAETYHTGLTVALRQSKYIDQFEREFIEKLINNDPFSRLLIPKTIMWEIDQLILNLRQNRPQTKQDTTLLLMLDIKNKKLVDKLEASGILDSIMEDEYADFDPMMHEADLKKKLNDLLKDSFFIRKSSSTNIILKGYDLTVEISQLNPTYEEPTWKAGVITFIYDDTAWLPEPERKLTNIRLEICTDWKDLYKRREFSRYTDWSECFPEIKNNERFKLARRNQNYKDCLSFLNHIDMVMLDARVFKYKRVPNDDYDETTKTQTVILYEDENNKTKRYDYLIPPRSMISNFVTEFENTTRDDQRFVLLTETDKLELNFNESIERWIVRENGIDEQNKLVSISFKGGKCEIPENGYIRTWGHCGETRLAARRQEAIERLDKHGFLMNTLSSPYKTRIDSGFSPVTQGESSLKIPEELEGTQLGTFQDVLRIRPIYTLQGPPGTGKSTLIRSLITEILKDDPMAQLLVTSKDHYAVDDMREKLTDKFKDKDIFNRPIQVRLSSRQQRRKGLKEIGSDDIHHILMKELIKEINQRLESNPCLSDNKVKIYSRWKDLITVMNHQLNQNPAEEVSQEDVNSLAWLQDLIQKSSSIMYATTSAGDLEELAKGEHTFDWVIVEEAGKTHAFDLALPMQTGHRWLLLGDQDQLRPYKHNEFEAGIENADEMITAFGELHDRNSKGKMIDGVFIEKMKQKEDLSSFKRFVKERLVLFKYLYDQLEKITGEDVISTADGNGAQAGFLNKQYRMNPDIAALVQLFYEREIENAEKTKKYLPPFKISSEHNHTAVIWVDTLPSAKDVRLAGSGYYNDHEIQTIATFLKKLSPSSNEPAESDEEKELVILTPYNLQKNRINNRADELNKILPDGYFFPFDKRLGKRQPAFSIDSFQGKEADIVIISLVRNSDPSNNDIRFIASPDRLNVMLSRSRKMLVFVGHWDFLRGAVEKYTYQDKIYGKFKRLMDTLETCFEETKAVKLNLNDLEKAK